MANISQVVAESEENRDDQTGDNLNAIGNILDNINNFFIEFDVMITENVSLCIH